MPSTLQEGITRIGSGSDCQVLVRGAGVAVHHCEIEMRDGDMLLRPDESWATTALNGRRIDDEVPLKSGDVLLFGRVGCQVRSGNPPGVPAEAENRQESQAAVVQERDSRTQVRGAVPDLVLRGMSGSVYGRSFAIRDGLVIGRSRDCDICLPTAEISRQHTRLRVIAQHLVVEDLGSTNGTFVDGERVSGSTALEAGSELGIDTVRFLLVKPGEAPDRAQATAVEETGPRRGTGVLGGWFGLALLSLILLGLLGWLAWRNGWLAI